MSEMVSSLVFFKQKTAYEMLRSLVGSEMCIRDSFWPLVDQDHHQVALRVVGRDCVGDRLENHRLASLRRADDQTALALADRGDQVDHPGGQHVRLGLQPQSVLRVERGQRGELRPLSTRLQVSAVDLVQAHQRVVLVVPLAVAGLADRPGHRVTTTQSCLLYTSDAADEEDSVDLGGRRSIKTK